MGFSGCSLRALDTGSVVAVHRMSCSTARGIFPAQGLNLCLLHWQMDSLPLSHQGNPLCPLISLITTLSTYHLFFYSVVFFFFFPVLSNQLYKHRNLWMFTYQPTWYHRNTCKNVITVDFCFSYSPKVHSLGFTLSVVVSVDLYKHNM